MHPNYWAGAPDPGSHNYWTHMPQLLKLTCPRAHGLQQEKPPQWEAHALQIESSPHSPQLKESPCCNEDPTLPNIKKETKSLAGGENSSSIPRALPLPVSHCVTAAVHMAGELATFSASVQLSPVAQSCPTLWPHESQHARPPCPSPTSGVHSNSRPLSRWCHPAISSSVVPFSSCRQSLPASGSFPMSQLWSFSFSISPSNEHPGLISFWMDWLDLLAVQGTLKSLIQHPTKT